MVRLVSQCLYLMSQLTGHQLSFLKNVFMLYVFVCLCVYMNVGEGI